MPHTSKTPKPTKKPSADRKEKVHPVRYFKAPYALFLGVLIILPLAFYWMRLINQGLAFQGPSSASGVGTGAVGLDANKNLSVGSPNPISDTKFFVLGSSTASTGFVMKVVQPGTTQTFSHSGQVPGNPLLLIRNDGKVGIAGFIGDTTTSTVVIGGNTRVDGVVAATSFTGSWTGTASAGNVSAGNFAANTGGGNFGFPASLAIGTASAPTQRLDVVGGNINVNGLSNSLMFNGRTDLGLFGDNNYSLSLQAPEGISINIDSNNNNTATPFTIRDGGTGTTGGTALFTVLESGRIGVGMSPANKFAVYDDSAAYTGSGYNSPSFALIASDTTSDHSGIRFANLSGSREAFLGVVQTAATTGDLVYQTYNSGAYGERLRITNAGNVGIGRTSPQTTLTVRSAGTEWYEGGIALEDDLANRIFFHKDTSNNLRIGLNGTEGMRMTSSLNFQVGENAAYGDVRFVVTDSSGDNDSTFLTVKRDGTTNPVFSIMPWDSQIYIGAGIYYSNSAWVHSSDDGNNQLLTMDPGTGVLWYASNNSTASWNVASAVQLWDSAGNGTFPSLTIGGGTGKINAGTIDPIYTINGVNYATYMAGMVGVKEETTGILQIPCDRGVCRRVIDFKNAAKGSDLWLFAKASDLSRHMDQMAVILSPAFEGKVWYEKSNGKLIVSARPERERSLVEVSYRFTAPRFDAEEWSNYNNDIGVKGFVIND